jgi:glycosyltransferase involved in cell wall biosynthesis
VNILFVMPRPDRTGGSERSAMLAAQALRDRGHRVSLLHGCPGWADAGAYDEALELSPLFDRWSKVPRHGFGTACRALDQWTADRAIDVVHVHDWPRTELFQHWHHRLPVVVTAHWALCPNGARYLWSDRAPCDHRIGAACVAGFLRHGCGHTGDGAPFGIAAFARAMLDDAWLRHAVARSARVIAPSQWMRRRLTADGLPAESITVIRPPIAEPPAIGAAPAVPDTAPPAVLFAGRLVEIKGADHLVRASALMGTPHVVWFAGDGVARDAAEGAARAAGIADRCHFLGHLPPEELAGLRQRCALAVIPSLAPENFSMAGAEALMAARPVVAYAAGGNAEWCRDGETGRLIPFGDVPAMAAAIDELLRSPALAARMGARGRQLAAEWVPSVHAARTEDVYRAVVAASGQVVTRHRR